jgi:putative membrane protein
MTQLKILTGLGAGIAALFGLCALSAMSAKAEDVDDSKFLQSAIQTDIAEIHLAKLAQQQSSDSGVKEYASLLQADHSKSLQKTSALAKTLGVTVPAEPSAEAQQHSAELAKLAGQDFDAEFVNHMIAGHRDAIKKFGEQAHANPNKAIADLAAQKLPTLKEHLAAAESLLGAGVYPSAQAHGGHEDDHENGRAEGRDDPQLRVPPEPSSPLR